MTQSMEPIPSQSSTTLTPTYRRNGKLQSCEPCRKGKLRCDHALPTCSRCVRRGKPDACIYHPAPLTKPRHSFSNSPRQRSLPPLTTATAASVSTYDRPQQALVSPPSSLEPQAAAFNEAQNFRPPQNPLALSSLVGPTSQILPLSYSRPATVSGYYPESMSVKENKTGYLGSSAYSAIFTENKNSLGFDAAEPERVASPSVPISADKIHKGAEILALFRDMRLVEMFLNRWFDCADGITIIKPMYGIWIRGITEEFGHILSSFQRVEDLYSISELVWRNTQKSVPVDGTTTTLQWGALQTGRNLRWEIVGALCSSLGLIAGELSAYDPVFVKARAEGLLTDRASVLSNMKFAVEETIDFCKICESITEVYVFVLYESVLLLESIRGDTYYGAWQRMGEACDTAILMGLHQEKRADERTPFIVAELRVRLFDFIYGHDKSISTFLGRPPRLSHRYCVQQLPLDLTDEEMCLEGAELQAAIAGLNNGWNTYKRVSRCTWRRVWAQHARLREDILEIALGTLTVDIEQRAQQIRERIQEVYAGMPEFVKSDIFEILENMHNYSHPIVGAWDRGKILINTVNMVCIHCGILHTSFLLERSVIARTNSTDISPLILKARELLRLVLAAVGRRDLLRDFPLDFVGLLAYHGLPAAGMLAVEMLKQEQSRLYTPHILPRSDTIQDLSVFISSLAAVGPESGNHFICNQGRKVLKRVLDKILSPDQAVMSRGSSSLDGAPVGDPNVYFPAGNDAEFMQWLENVEWERGSLFN